VPQRAVIELQGSYQLALVDETNAIHLQTIQVGPQIGEDWLVESGVKPGDHVIVEGTEKARDGLVVDPQPYTPPAQNNSSGQHAGN
jgi:multidrug efflux pump subunit AcrA (membrane-fusion protein)